MDTVKYKGERYHVGCGGLVARGLCLKCGEKKPGLLKRIVGSGPLVTNEKETKAEMRQEHRKRIRLGKDIFKE